MVNQFYSKRHFRLIHGTPDTSETIAWRKRNQEILTQVRAEVIAKFPSITFENAKEVIDWQEARIQELHRQ